MQFKGTAARDFWSWFCKRSSYPKVLIITSKQFYDVYSICKAIKKICHLPALASCAEINSDKIENTLAQCVDMSFPH